eukprot:69387_1
MSSQHRSVAPEEIGLIQRKIHSVRDGTDNDYMRSVDAVQSDFTSAVTDLESVHHYDVKQIQSRFDRKGKTVEEMYQAEKEKTEEKIEQLLRYLEESNLPIMPSSSCSDDLNGGSNSSMHITRAANGSLTRLLIPPWDMDAGHLKAESARPLTVVRAGTGFCSDGSKATGNERITRSKAKRNGNSQGFHVTLPESDIRDDLSRIGDRFGGAGPLPKRQRTPARTAKNGARSQVIHSDDEYRPRKVPRFPTNLPPPDRRSPPRSSKVGDKTFKLGDNVACLLNDGAHISGEIVGLTNTAIEIRRSNGKSFSVWRQYLDNGIWQLVPVVSHGPPIVQSAIPNRSNRVEMVR